MVVFLALPMLMLIAGFLALIIYAIISKKWALLFIPLGLVMLFTVFIGLHFVSSTESQHLVRNRATAARVQAVQDTHVRQGNSSNNSDQVAEYSLDGSVKVTRNQPNVVHTSVTPNLAFTSLILLIGLLALVVLIVIAIIRKKWAMLFIPLGVGALGVLSIFYLRAGHISPRQEQIAVAEYPQMIEAAADKPLPAVWSPGMEKEFTASNYYSISAALRGIAARSEKYFRQLALQDHPIPKKIALVTYRDEIDENVFAQAVSYFQQLLPETEFIPLSVGIDSIESYDNRIALRVTLSKHPHSTVTIRVPGKPDIVKTSKDGQITIETHTKTSSHKEVVSFQDRPWLENLDAYSNARPGNHYLIAYSQNPASSYESAKAQAENQATQLVAERIFQVARSLPQYDGRVENYSISRDDLWNYGLVEDQFAQSLSGKASNIHRQAILLNLLPQNVQRLAENKLGVYKAARQSWAYHILSAIGIALVICVIYLILNAATKGYYTVVLRILTVIGIIAVVILLTMV
ncbi:MAG: hypothetical protein K9M75_05625 [Phycisphaerae bacterium]|nr:hypothetical protein [Phycisphaerae bacterium]